MESDDFAKRRQRLLLCLLSGSEKIDNWINHIRKQSDALDEIAGFIAPPFGQKLSDAFSSNLIEFIDGSEDRSVSLLET